MPASFVNKNCFYDHLAASLSTGRYCLHGNLVKLVTSRVSEADLYGVATACGEGARGDTWNDGA